MNYESEEIKQTYPQWLDSLYKLIFTADEKINGRIITAYDRSGHKDLKITFSQSEL
jgi:hypothetical protein